VVQEASASEHLSPAEQIQQRVLLYVTNANSVMRAKLQALDLYRQSAIHSKHLQHTLLANVGSTDDKTPPAKIRELSVDTKTWQHREQAPNNEGHSVLERLEMKLDQLKKNMDEQKNSKRGELCEHGS